MASTSPTNRDAQLLERDFAGDVYTDQDLVFCDELGGPIHPQRLTEWFRPVHIVAARLGDTPQTVLGTYAHLLPQSDEIAAERISDALAR